MGLITALVRFAAITIGEFMAICTLVSGAVPIFLEPVTLPLLPRSTVLITSSLAPSACIAITSSRRIVQRCSQRTSVPGQRLPQTNTMSNEISTPDGKHIMPGTHEDIESNDEKVASGIGLQGPSYENQGTDEERALIFKQDLRIIPLCSVSTFRQVTSASANDEEQFIYLLCYLDRSNIGNAKVGHIHLHQPPAILMCHRFSTKKMATIFSPRPT